MKKVIFILIILTIVGSMFFDKNSEDNEEIRGVFFSYIELSKYIKGYTEEESKENIRKVINNVCELKFNTIFLQVRAAADSIYDSDIYPYSLYVTDKEENDRYDILKYFLEVAKEKKVKIYAWINPYRVRTKEDVSSITKESPAFKYLNTDYLYVGSGVFFNPSKQEVEDLIVEGVKEVLNYHIDGIIFDDYFYPNDNIDDYDYLKYIDNNEKISKEEYHFYIINKMIKRVHEECKKKNVLFGISPDGNIENNYRKNYADVKLWMKSSEYIDFIMPQIYYGFYNSSKAYVNVIKEWESYLDNEDIDLLVALAFYKVGNIDNYAKDGKYEWLNNDNIIMREVILSRNLKNYKGFSLFRYDSIFDNNNENSVNEIINLKKYL